MIQGLGFRGLEFYHYNPLNPKFAKARSAGSARKRQSLNPSSLNSPNVKL